MAATPVGKVLTARGPVEPGRLGRVMMHEHLHSDLWDWDNDRLIVQEKPATPRRRAYLMQNAVPLLRRAREEFGMNAFCDATMPPWRAWPDLCRDVSEAADTHMIIATGFYREIEVGTYFVKHPRDAIWPVVRESSMEELADLCIREIADGIHGTDVRAGCIKLGTSQPPMTEAEMKAFRAGARAQKATGVHITTHCTWLGAETSQLTVLDQEGVDLSRVVVGHTAAHIASPAYRRTILSWMRRGANFLPTNIAVRDPADWSRLYQPLVDGIREIFDAGHGDKLLIGLDSGYCSESGPFAPMSFLPPDPWLYLFTDVLPAFREMGLSAEQEEQILVRNPARILPVQ